MIGKTTTLEFALGLPDDTKPFPVPRNPWSRSHWCGGSSAGSAAGVAAGMMTAAVGTDTGSSIRMPSALCGVTGLKPTFGLVPKSGCVPLAFSLDHVGPLGRSAQDCALLLDAMAGHRSAGSKLGRPRAERHARRSERRPARPDGRRRRPLAVLRRAGGPAAAAAPRRPRQRPATSRRRRGRRRAAVLRRGRLGQSHHRPSRRHSPITRRTSAAAGTTTSPRPVSVWLSARL